MHFHFLLERVHNHVFNLSIYNALGDLVSQIRFQENKFTGYIFIVLQSNCIKLTCHAHWKIQIKEYFQIEHFSFFSPSSSGLIPSNRLFSLLDEGPGYIFSPTTIIFLILIFRHKPIPCGRWDRICPKYNITMLSLYLYFKLPNLSHGDAIVTFQ